MKWTNKFGVPGPLFEALTTDKYRNTADYSATQIINPPQYVQLMQRHKDEIVQDCTDATWRVLGSCIHDLLARQSDFNRLIEERLKSTEIGGVTLSGQPDLVEPVGSKVKVTDYKVTSVWSFLLGTKEEWVTQLNIYAYLLRKHGFEVESLQIVAILRDWTQSKTHEPKYPPCQVHVEPVELWRDDVVEQIVQDRIKIHEAVKEQPDSQLPPCTPYERWERPTTWAVIKKGNKRAYRVLDNPDEAENLAAEMSSVACSCFVNDTPLPDCECCNGSGMKPAKAIYNVIKRPGEAVRCERFCPVKDFCVQFQNRKDGE